MAIFCSSIIGSRHMIVAAHYGTAHAGFGAVEADAEHPSRAGRANAQR